MKNTNHLQAVRNQESVFGLTSSGLWFSRLIRNKADSSGKITDNLERTQAKAKRAVIPVFVKDVHSSFLACTGSGTKTPFKTNKREKNQSIS